MLSNRGTSSRHPYGVPNLDRISRGSSKRKSPEPDGDLFFKPAHQTSMEKSKKQKTTHDPLPRIAPKDVDRSETTKDRASTLHERSRAIRTKPPPQAYRSRRRRLEDPNRIHYDTVKLVHQTAYTAASDGLNRSIEKIITYDPVKDYEKKAEKARSTKGSANGDRKLEMIKYWLDNLGLKRHHHQIRFHEHMIKACLSKIYEEEWETQFEQITHRFGIEKMKREGLYTCPRRFGKTTAVAIYCAAFLLVIPGSKVAVFATGKRTAKKLMMQIVGFLIKYPGFLDHVKTKNQEDLILDFGISDERMLSCYPSTVKSNLDWISFRLFESDDDLSTAASTTKTTNKIDPSDRKKFATMNDFEKISFFDMIDGILRETEVVPLDFIDPRSKEIALVSARCDISQERFVSSKILKEKDSFLASSFYHSKAPLMTYGMTDELERKRCFSEMIFKTLAGLFFSSNKYVPLLNECCKPNPPSCSGLDTWFIAFYKSFFLAPESERFKKKTKDFQKESIDRKLTDQEPSETTISEHVARLDFFFRFCDAMTDDGFFTKTVEKDASLWKDGKLIKPDDPTGLTFVHTEWVRIFIVEAYERAFNDAFDASKRKKVYGNVPEDRKLLFKLEKRLAYVLEPIMRHIWGGAIVTYAYDESENELKFERRYAGMEVVSLETTTFAYFMRVGDVYNVLTRCVSGRPRSNIRVERSILTSDVSVPTLAGWTSDVSVPTLAGCMDHDDSKFDVDEKKERACIKISCEFKKTPDVDVYLRLESDHREASTVGGKKEEGSYESWPERVPVYMVDMIADSKARFDVPLSYGPENNLPEEKKSTLLPRFEWEILSPKNAYCYALDFREYDFDATREVACFWVFPPTVKSKDGSMGFVCLSAAPKGGGYEIVCYKNDFYYGKIDHATLDKMTIVTKATETSVFYFIWFYNLDDSRGTAVRFCDLEDRMAKDFLNAILIKR